MSELEGFLEALDTSLYDHMLLVINHNHLDLMCKQGLDFPNQSDNFQRLMVNSYKG